MIQNRSVIKYDKSPFSLTLIISSFFDEEEVSEAWVSFENAIWEATLEAFSSIKGLS